MRNGEIADALDELGVLYELDGANQYRVIAYREAARVARQSPVALEQLAGEGRLTELPGIGKTLAQKIVDLIATGEIPSATKLKRKIPPSLVEVTRIRGVGAKTARRIYDELGIENLEQLRAAAESQQLRELKGLGPRMEENVLAALAGIADETSGARFLLSEVRPIAEELATALREHPVSGRVAVGGSLRRWTDTCKDIDIVATATEPAALAATFVSHPLVDAPQAAGGAGARIVTHNGIAVDLRIAPPEAFGNLLQHFSGSAEHNVALRELALSMGLSVSEHGVADTESGEVTLCAEEAEVYQRLGLAFIEPELRENAGELDAARQGTLPELVELGDIRGDLHCHTTLSDGQNTLSEMAEAAKARGYAYLAITDHSATHGFGNDVTPRALERRIAEVRDWNSGKRGFRLLAGSEVNVGPKGSLDYPDELLAELDWVIASVHSSFDVGEERMTDRVLAAIEHPLVDCIGHLTGRLLLRREPYRVDVERIFAAAAQNGTMLEINANPRRRDLSDRHARLAAESGVRIVVSTDAHRVQTLNNMMYGVATARRAWLTAEQVANTRPWREFAKLRKRA